MAAAAAALATAKPARLKEQAEGTRDVFMMDPRKLTEMPGWNVREEGPELEAHIQRLVDSIREVGVKEPLKIFQQDGQILVTNGHCRLRAVNRLLAEGVEIKAIPCMPEDRYANEADRVLSMITCNSGKPLTPFELAQVCKRLINYAWSVSDIATKTGFTEKYITDLLDFQAGPKGVVDMVRDGRVSAGLAVKTLKKNGAEQAVKVLQAAEAIASANGKTKVTPKHVKAHEAATSQASKPATSAAGVNWNKVGPELMKLVLSIRGTLGTKRDSAVSAAVEFAEGLE